MGEFNDKMTEKTWRGKLAADGGADETYTTWSAMMLVYHRAGSGSNGRNVGSVRIENNPPISRDAMRRGESKGMERERRRKRKRRREEEKDLGKRNWLWRKEDYKSKNREGEGLRLQVSLPLSLSFSVFLLIIK